MSFHSKIDEAKEKHRVVKTMLLRLIDGKFIYTHSKDDIKNELFKIYKELK